MSKKKKYKREVNKIRENILNQKEEAKEIIEESLSETSKKNKKVIKEASSKEEVILMAAPRKSVAELPVHEKAKVKISAAKESPTKEGKSVKIDFGDEVEHTTASKEELPKITNKKNIPINGVREHISLGKIFIWFIAFLVAYLIIGQILNLFGPTTISLLSLWPLLLIFVGLSLFKVKKRGATRLIAGFFVFLIFAASVAIVFKGGNIVTINTTGELVAEERGVDPFTSVNFEAVGKIKFTLGDRELVVVRADEAIIKEVETKVENGELIINYGNALWKIFLFDKTNIEVEVISRDISKIVVAGKAEVLVDGIEGKKLDFEISGVGNGEIRNINVEELIVRLNGNNEVVKTSGDAIIEYVLLRGVGTYDGKELASSKTIVKISGDADAFVNTTKELSVLIEGPGNVIYSGGAEIKEKTIKGKGTLLSEEEYLILEKKNNEAKVEVESIEDSSVSDSMEASVMNAEENKETKESEVQNSEEIEPKTDDSSVVEDAEGFLKSINSEL